MERAFCFFYRLRLETMRLRVVGYLKGVPFHMAKCAAEALKLSFDAKFIDPSIQPLHEFDWHLFLAEKKQELKGEIWEYPSTVMCFIDNRLLGDETAILKWAYKNWAYTDFRPLQLYRTLAEDFCITYMKSTKHVFVYMDITMQENPVGRLLFELFSDICPQTCENFRSLCTGEAGTSKSGLELTYKGSIFHRVVRKGWIQGGDIKSGAGTGGESIYGITFGDENFAVPHYKRGILAMANKGRHTNGSQFYITLQATPYLDRKYVAFGVTIQEEAGKITHSSPWSVHFNHFKCLKNLSFASSQPSQNPRDTTCHVSGHPSHLWPCIRQLIEGSEVLQELENVPTCNERPEIRCVVTDCGVFNP